MSKIVFLFYFYCTYLYYLCYLFTSSRNYLQLATVVQNIYLIQSLIHIVSSDSFLILTCLNNFSLFFFIIYTIETMLHSNLIKLFLVFLLAFLFFLHSYFTLFCCSIPKILYHIKLCFTTILYIIGLSV